MIKYACLGFLLIIALHSPVFGQNLIGIQKDGAEEYVRKVMKGFNLDNSTRNESFNYLKFLNSSGTITLIVFFSEDNISTHTRMMCDYSEFDFIKEDYDRKYRKVADNSWEFTDNNEKFEIKLEEKDWYFVVTTKKK